MNDKQYIILDIETTGLSKETSRITEIAAVIFDGHHIVSKFQTLVNPQKDIPHFITRLTGIDNQMVKNSPTIDVALSDFFDFMGDHIIVAHNATFDYGFLNHNGILHLSKPINNHIVCTRKLANRLLPDLTSKRLEILCNHFAITNQRAHRAMADVLATTEVFQRFLELLKHKGIEDKEHIIQFQNFAMHKCR